MSTTASENPTSGEQPQGSTAEGENGNPVEGEAAPSIEELSSKVDDLTKHSRKWEERAKANKEKADRLDELEAASLSAEQKAQKALESAEAKYAEAEERAAAAETALTRMRIAADFGLTTEDADLFLTASDEDTMKAQAKRFSERAGDSNGPRPPRPNNKQGNRSGDGPRSSKDVFGDFLDSQLS